MKRAEDDIEKMLFNRYLSEDGKIEVGVWTTIFGFRVRAGFVDGQPELDYCAGADQGEVERIFSAVVACIDKGLEWENFPFQTRKPMLNNPECMAELLALAGPHEQVPVVPVGAIRALTYKINNISPETAKSWES